MNRRLQFLKRFLIGVIAIVLIVYVAYKAYQPFENRRLVTNMLQLEPLPNSIRNIECVGYGFTDVLTTCYFEIDPADSEILLANLKGLNFTHEKPNPPILSQKSWCGSRPEIGSEFLVSDEFTAVPKEAKYGGSISLCHNAQKDRMLIHLYIE